MTSDNNPPGPLPRPAAGVPVAFDPLPQPELEHRPRGASLTGKRIVLCVTGSIAAYKAVVLLRLLLKQAAHVEVIITESAQRFVQASTFSALTARPVHKDMFAESGEVHVDLARQADAILVVPATADALARLAHGHASDLMTALVLAARCPIIIAPAMHPSMWEHPRTQHNFGVVRSTANHYFAGPATGEVASGDIGAGRMVEPEQIIETLLTSLAPRDLSGRHIVISAGPTREALDPVRFLSNRSSGKMGFALAAGAARRGARVTLISGPVELATPAGVERIDVQTALQMESALTNVLGPELQEADALVMAAAVADYRASGVSEEKLKRGSEMLTLKLVPNPDILAGIGQRRLGKTPLLVGFALETCEAPQLIPLARHKLIKKRVDLIVANSSEALEGDDTRAMLVGVRSATDLKALKKDILAEHILDWIVEKLEHFEFDEATE